ncbi:MAG: biopolymer transporter ExbD [Thiomargarita sp.]|nr:biopolymer transporter ExbD [Thiomargarita sp.]
MNFRRCKNNDNLRINLTPLIDTVFLLLIFFMMTTTFNKEAQLNIDLPEAKAETTVQPTDLIRIIVNNKGEYAIDNVENALINSELDTLKQALKKQAGNNDNPSLLISADKNAPHYAVMRAMEAVRDLGFLRLSFEAQSVPE